MAQKTLAAQDWKKGENWLAEFSFCNAELNELIKQLDVLIREIDESIEGEIVDSFVISSRRVMEEATRLFNHISGVAPYIRMLVDLSIPLAPPMPPLTPPTMS